MYSRRAFGYVIPCKNLDTCYWYIGDMLSTRCGLYPKEWCFHHHLCEHCCQSIYNYVIIQGDIDHAQTFYVPNRTDGKDKNALHKRNVLDVYII